ncbi:MAG: YhcH/YjgK/YiaL family protein [Candidatus Accumulibacter sp.]|jgi:YhcH/YjgK/YiaL family protein|nr:YhcH/YjgK/YiaL family protein [Accumulibacter sp.]
MIIGRISDAAAQKGLLPAAVVRALEVLDKIDLGAAAPGRYEIEGDKLFYTVSDAELGTLADIRAEAHRQYADIQIPVSTVERYGFALPQPNLAPADDQFAEKDLAFYPDPPGEAFIDAAPGDYLVFLPEELHRPRLSPKGEKTIRKVIAKVHRSLLGL